MEGIRNRILIVEDEPDLRKILKVNLGEQGYATEEAETAQQATALLSMWGPDLLLLDLGLPDMDGQVLIENIRKLNSVPIIVLSARNQETEKVRALDSGADDYLTKPFGKTELLARIRVALRHKSVVESPGERRFYGPLEWDPQYQRVYLKGSAVHLTQLEYRLFEYLASHPGRILTLRVLLQEIWKTVLIDRAPAVRVALASLRRKIGEHERKEKLIETEVGTGYRFVGEDHRFP